MMCIICSAYEAGKISRKEARDALLEMINSGAIKDDHILEVEYLVIDEDGEDD